MRSKAPRAIALAAILLPAVGCVSPYKHNPISPSLWQIETADSSAPDVGRFTSMVYDPLDPAILVAYYDATNGDLKLARRTAN